MSMCAEMKKFDPAACGTEAQGAVSADDVEVADIVNDAVQRKQNDERKCQEDDQRRVKEARASDAWREKVRRERRRRKVEAIGGTVLFGALGVAVLAGMFGEMIHPMFALPLSSVYFMRAAVKLDRYRRG